jgi:DNA-binding XRE family transcriptional regulator
LQLNDRQFADCSRAAIFTVESVDGRTGAVIAGVIGGHRRDACVEAPTVVFDRAVDASGRKLNTSRHCSCAIQQWVALFYCASLTAMAQLQRAWIGLRGARMQRGRAAGFGSKVVFGAAQNQMSEKKKIVLEAGVWRGHEAKALRDLLGWTQDKLAQVVGLAHGTAISHHERNADKELPSQLAADIDRAAREEGVLVVRSGNVDRQTQFSGSGMSNQQEYDLAISDGGRVEVVRLLDLLVASTNAIDHAFIIDASEARIDFCDSAMTSMKGKTEGIEEAYVTNTSLIDFFRKKKSQSLLVSNEGPDPSKPEAGSRIFLYRIDPEGTILLGARTEAHVQRPYHFGIVEKKVREAGDDFRRIFRR